MFLWHLLHASRSITRSEWPRSQASRHDFATIFCPLPALHARRRDPLLVYCAAVDQVIPPLLSLQVRRRLKRAEAAQTMSRTGQLRIVVGAIDGTQGARGSSSGDSYGPSHAGWLVTDENTLDVTDPSDFM